MAIFNLGSVNIDHFYDVPHLPAPGETLAASTHKIGLGGKGVNQSVAAAKAGAQVKHIGAIGVGDDWVPTRMEEYGVDCTHLQVLEGATGHAIIYVDEAGENSIVLASGANAKIESDHVESALVEAKSGDIFMIQNETNGVVEAARRAQEKGLRVVYSAAPFDVGAIKEILPFVSLLVVNEVEAAQLGDALGLSLSELKGFDLIVTLGGRGAMWQSGTNAQTIDVVSPQVEVVDTTAAGDTFIGYVVAGLDLGKSIKAAMEWATLAAGLKVTRAGTADAIPTHEEVELFATDI